MVRQEVVYFQGYRFGFFFREVGSFFFSSLASILMIVRSLTVDLRYEINNLIKCWIQPFSLLSDIRYKFQYYTLMLCLAAVANLEIGYDLYKEQPQGPHVISTNIRTYVFFFSFRRVFGPNDTEPMIEPSTYSPSG